MMLGFSRPGGEDAVAYVIGTISTAVGAEDVLLLGFAPWDISEADRSMTWSGWASALAAQPAPRRLSPSVHLMRAWLISGAWGDRPVLLQNPSHGV
jgi:hypothetical protein